MADLTFSVHPLDLANALFNAVEVSKDAGGRPGCPHILIQYGPDEDYQAGQVLVYGIGRIVGGRTTLTLDTKAPDDYATVCITREEAQEMQSMLRQVKGGKAARVSVRICEDGVETVDFDESGEPDVGIYHLLVDKGDDETFIELCESDPNQEWGRHLDLIDTILKTVGDRPEGPVALSLEGMDRITALKGVGSKIMDIATTDRDHVVAIAVGPTFRGILATIDRGIYEDQEGFLLTEPAVATRGAHKTPSAADAA